MGNRQRYSKGDRREILYSLLQIKLAIILIFKVFSGAFAVLFVQYFKVSVYQGNNIKFINSNFCLIFFT